MSAETVRVGRIRSQTLPRNPLPKTPGKDWTLLQSPGQMLTAVVGLGVVGGGKGVKGKDHLSQILVELNSQHLLTRYTRYWAKHFAQISSLKLHHSPRRTGTIIISFSIDGAQGGYGRGENWNPGV